MTNRIRLLFCAAALVVMATGAAAQDTGQDGYRAFRTNTWSLYAEGGASGVTGLDFRNVSSSMGTNVAPLAGFGIDYNIRPWIRIGLNYEFTKYRREQRFSEFQSVTPSYSNPSEGFTELVSSTGGIAYNRMWTQHHDIDLSLEFNLADIWTRRKAQWFNLYVGVGAGMLFANGNTYTIAMGSEHWTDPDNYDASGLAVGDNWQTTAYVTTGNVRHDFNAFYVPVSMSVEFDVAPRLTLGVRGQYKAVFSDHELAPNGIETLGMVVRYNLLGRRHGYRSYRNRAIHAEREYDALAADYEALRLENEDLAERAGKEDGPQRIYEAINGQTEALSDRLSAREDALRIPTEAAKELPDVLTVHFGLNEAKVSDTDKSRLEQLAREMTADQSVEISLTAEASADGNDASNQRLSERRLKNVMKVLNNNGIDGSRIRSARAIGASNRSYDPSVRRVEILVHK